LSSCTFRSLENTLGTTLKRTIPTSKMKLGFCRHRAITSTIVTGLKSAADNSVSVLLSPRNEETSASHDSAPRAGAEWKMVHAQFALRSLLRPIPVVSDLKASEEIMSACGFRQVICSIAVLAVTQICNADEGCPRTIGANEVFLEPWPQAETWFGSESLAVILPQDGIWPTTVPGHLISVKLFWYSVGSNWSP
jgi:hypothetical protein